MKNYQIVLTTFISFGVAYGILMGTIPSYYFAGPENEMGCFVIALTLGVLSLIAWDWKGLGMWLVGGHKK